MKDISYWNKFEKTGDIKYYLNYTACACTCEEKINNKILMQKEGGFSGNTTSESYRNSTNCNAN